MKNIILFDSEVRHQLLPLTFTRPVADLRCGILTIGRKWEKVLCGQVSHLCENYLSEKYKNVRWIDGLDFKKDLDGWFALICACDDIISVSTALVHFAGAAGRSVHLLLSDRGAPFIWGLQDDSSIAYPDIKIYRKRHDLTDDEFFDDVARRALGGES